eukprot:GHVN01074135.1.p1 GENE.GHVN01074135.1~~GHVN01074135.1.p1  ORF type:complete len:1043 (+),score=141.49 GHVN01074135.1:2848-5976(+)
MSLQVNHGTNFPIASPPAVEDKGETSRKRTPNERSCDEPSVQRVAALCQSLEELGFTDLEKILVNSDQLCASAKAHVATLVNEMLVLWTSINNNDLLRSSQTKFSRETAVMMGRLRRLNRRLCTLVDDSHTCLADALECYTSASTRIDWKRSERDWFLRRRLNEDSYKSETFDSLWEDNRSLSQEEFANRCENEEWWVPMEVSVERFKLNWIRFEKQEQEAAREKLQLFKNIREKLLSDLSKVKTTAPSIPAPPPLYCKAPQDKITVKVTQLGTTGVQVGGETVDQDMAGDAAPISATNCGTVLVMEYDNRAFNLSMPLFNIYTLFYAAANVDLDRGVNVRVGSLSKDCETPGELTEDPTGDSHDYEVIAEIQAATSVDSMSEVGGAPPGVDISEVVVLHFRYEHEHALVYAKSSTHPKILTGLFSDTDVGEVSANPAHHLFTDNGDVRPTGEWHPFLWAQSLAKISWDVNSAAVHSELIKQYNLERHTRFLTALATEKWDAQLECDSVPQMEKGGSLAQLPQIDILPFLRVLRHRVWAGHWMRYYLNNCRFLLNSEDSEGPSTMDLSPPTAQVITALKVNQCEGNEFDIVSTVIDLDSEKSVDPRDIVKTRVGNLQDVSSVIASSTPPFGVGPRTLPHDSLAPSPLGLPPTSPPLLLPLEAKKSENEVNPAAFFMQPHPSAAREVRHLQIDFTITRGRSRAGGGGDEGKRGHGCGAARLSEATSDSTMSISVEGDKQGESDVHVTAFFAVPLDGTSVPVCRVILESRMPDGEKKYRIMFVEDLVNRVVPLQFGGITGPFRLHLFFIQIHSLKMALTRLCHGFLDPLSTSSRSPSLEEKSRRDPSYSFLSAFQSHVDRTSPPTGDAGLSNRDKPSEDGDTAALKVNRTDSNKVNRFHLIICHHNDPLLLGVIHTPGTKEVLGIKDRVLSLNPQWGSANMKPPVKEGAKVVQARTGKGKSSARSASTSSRVAGRATTPQAAASSGTAAKSQRESDRRSESRSASGSRGSVGGARSRSERDSDISRGKALPGREEQRYSGRRER